MPSILAYSVAVAGLAAQVSAHGVLTSITGGNGVTMPGLSIIDGTPRTCATPGCGSEADTTVFRGNAPLGRTQGGGAVTAETNMKIFMGMTDAPAAGAAGAKKSGRGGATGGGATLGRRAGGLGGLFGGGAAGAGAGGAGGLLGGLGGGAAGGAGGAGAAGGLLGGLGGGKAAGAGGAGGLGGLLGGGAAGGAGGGATAKGVKTSQADATEGIVAKMAGTGASSGLPTVADDNSITVNLHQVNQDGAGPFTASIDTTSGGTDASAFKPTTIMENVGGLGFGGLSGVTTTDFPVKIAVPAGTKCTGTVAGVQNVCIVKMQNSALAGPFGGSAAFTHNNATA